MPFLDSRDNATVVIFKSHSRPYDGESPVVDPSLAVGADEVTSNGLPI